MQVCTLCQCRSVVENVRLNREEVSAGQLSVCLRPQICLLTTDGLFARITAYVVKVFSLAHSIIGVDKAQVCAPLLYLLKNKYDESRNSFREDNPVYSPTIMVSDRRWMKEITAIKAERIDLLLSCFVCCVRVVSAATTRRKPCRPLS